MNKRGAPENLIHFSKENQPSPEKRRGGKRPSIVKKYIKDNNISAEDVSAMAKYIIPLTQKQLQTLFNDEKQPFLMRLFARAIVDDMKAGKLDNILKIMDRAVGKQIDTIVKQEIISTNITTNNYAELTDTQLREQLHLLESPIKKKIV